MSRRTIYLAIAVIVVAAAVLGGCGCGCDEEATDSDMDGVATTTTEAMSTTTEAMATTTEAMPTTTEAMPTTTEPDVPDIPETVPGQYVDLTPEQANALIDTMPSVVIIDVSPYYADGHLPGAVNYYPDTALAAAIPTLDMDATYLVYCHADGPAIAGAQALVDAGFEKVYRLEGNYSAWVDAGYPVEM